MHRSHSTRNTIALVAVGWLLIWGSPRLVATAQLTAPETPAANESPAAEPVPGEPTGEPGANVAQRVEVAPLSSDEQISQRLTEILEATGWFSKPRVSVDRGVVFMSGQADSDQHRQWAEATAMRTSDVVAVVNRITVTEPPFWNFAPAWQSLIELTRETTRLLPLALVAVVIAVLSYYLARLAGMLTRRFAARRVESTLLREVFGNVVAVLVLVIGVYIALRVSGLTRLAVTLLGGTGLVGLALGFAFRDIAENYLASILISLNHPFHVGDLIEVEQSKGFVRRVTTRGTILNTIEGNQVQIPNSTVYKSKVINYTTTPLMRMSFKIGIGFDDSIAQAQDLIMNLLTTHQAVKEDPAPLVLVESLGAATVNLQVLYWMDQQAYSPLKVGSSIIRQVKEALVEAKITMPDEAREIVFPQGVPVHILKQSAQGSVDGETLKAETPTSMHRRSQESPVNRGEGDLLSEQSEVMRVTQDGAPGDDQTNLID